MFFLSIIQFHLLFSRSATQWLCETGQPSWRSLLADCTKGSEVCASLTPLQNEIDPLSEITSCQRLQRGKNLGKRGTAGGKKAGLDSTFSKGWLSHYKQIISLSECTLYRLQILWSNVLVRCKCIYSARFILFRELLRLDVCGMELDLCEIVWQFIFHTHPSRESQREIEAEVWKLCYCCIFGETMLVHSWHRSDKADIRKSAVLSPVPWSRPTSRSIKRVKALMVEVFGSGQEAEYTASRRYRVGEEDFMVNGTGQVQLDTFW